MKSRPSLISTFPVVSELDRFLAEAVANGIPAVTLHVRHHGQVLYEHAAGWLDPDTHQQPNQPSIHPSIQPSNQPTTYFDLASLTKLFTATAFLRLVAAGKVKLATPVADVLPQFTGRRPIQPYEDPLHPGQFLRVDATGKTTGAQDVTFHQLLAHTSGLPAWRPLYRQPANAIREFTLGTFFAYPIGATVLYSDLGFILLGWAIERLTGRPLDQAIAQLVCNQLNLSQIRFGPLPPGQTAPTEICPWRGRRIHGEVHDENAWAMGGIAGHAGLFGSGAAVAAFGQAWLDALGGASHFLPPPLALQAGSLQAEAGTVRRGLGWALWSPDPDSPAHPLSTEAFGHTGFTGTSLYVDPQRRLVIACLTNELYNGRQNRAITPFRRALHELIVRLLQ